MTGGAVAGVLSEVARATPHTALPPRQHSPRLADPALLCLAADTVTGAVHTQPCSLLGAHGTLAHTLRGLPDQEETGAAARALLTAGAGTLIAGVVAGQTQSSGGGEGGRGAGGDTTPVVFLIATLLAVRRART